MPATLAYWIRILISRSAASIRMAFGIATFLLMLIA